MFVLLAGCATSEDSGQKTDESIFAGADQDAQQYAGELALSEVYDRAALFEDVGEMVVSRVLIDEEGRAHARLSQTINGIPVFEGEAIVQLGKDGKFDTVTDRFARKVKVDFSEKINAKDALDIAVNEFGGADMLVGEPKIDKQILRYHGKDQVTYRAQLEMRNDADELTMPVVFVDAQTRQIVRSYDNLETVKNRKTYTAKNRTSLPGALLRSEGQAAGADAVANQAHDNAGFVHDYYSSKHSRDSFDGAGAIITSSVHYSRNYVNAFWNGTQMVYGDGDGVQSSALTVLDVVGHEITHAVTERSSALVYQNESGALNEAMSDIFGASIEAFRDGAVSANTWKIGEECWTPGTAGDSLRNMGDPAQYGDYDYWPTRYTGTSDNGGVHWNSGIANLAFKLAVTGGTHPRGKTSNNVPALSSDAVTSIEMGAKIFYRANTQCLTAGSTFQDASGCTRDAAQALYGSSAAASIAEAWNAVGVPAPLTWTVRDTQGNLSAANNGTKSFTLVVPAGATALKFSTAGANGDADLYVRKGSAPTTATYDCRSAGANSNESCTFTNVPAGATYYVMINAYTAYNGLTYTASSGQ
jgi:vibriolysin